jgi:hypothetical protein
MTEKTSMKLLDIDFNPHNAFHQIVKEIGYDRYVRIIEMATLEQAESIQKCLPIAQISRNVRNRALELFANKNLLSGMRLEDELGL